VQYMARCDLLNHPGFDAHLLRWEGGTYAEQVRRADPGQGGPSGH
jgi:hypothetical protein